ncbi:MAG: hypothetical protein Q4G69_13635 [Planctomycetia bacterium]|nr:hypothetical protein [Planctomycetia bacterium]
MNGQTGRPATDPRMGRGVLNTPGSRPGVPVPKALPSQRLAQQAPASRGRGRTSCVLLSSRTAGTTDLVEVVMEGSGTMNPVSEAGSDDASGEKMEVVAGFRYEERTLKYKTDGGDPDLFSVRQFEQAGMKQKIGDNITRTVLDASRKNTGCQYKEKKLLEFSPGGPLKSDQYSLLSELPFNSVLLDLLLPGKEVRLGEEWGISADLLASLLNLEAVENNTVRFTLTAIIDDIAEVDFYLQGGKNEKGEDLPSTISGAWQGASVSTNLEGKYQFDLRNRRLTWLGVRISEQRSGSLVEPALDWTAVVRIRIARLGQPEKLNNDFLETLSLKTDSDNLRLFYDGKNAPWTFYHTRNWRIIEDNARNTALCLVVGGEGIAQCNISANEQVKEGKMPSMEFYKKELKKGLGERFGRFVKESEFKTEDGDLVYAVLVDGKFEEQSFRWLYYLITSPEGCQSSIMYEVRADKLEKFNESGLMIFNTFKMIIPEAK